MTNDSKNNDELEQEAQRAGIQPVQLQVIENDKMEVKRVFMGMAIVYHDEKEVIPVIQTTTGLEYEITTKIKRLVETNKPVLALAKAEGQQIENRTITSLLQQRYTVRNIDLQNSIEDNIELILVNGLEDSLQENERKNLENFPKISKFWIFQKNQDFRFFQKKVDFLIFFQNHFSPR